MMMKMFNNGYIVQELCNNSYSLANTMYKGIEYSPSWPLKTQEDNVSVELEKEAWTRWFSYTDSLGTVTDKDFVKRYVSHCYHNKIKTKIIMVEVSSPSYVEPDELHFIEELGFDCIGGSELSYLNVTEECLKKYFFKTYQKLNKNGICENEFDAIEFLQNYSRLLKQGVNLESYGTPVVARLSLVSI